MTLLAAVRTSDGLAVVSDRKESYVDRSPKNVKKYHLDKRGRFYVSLAGDGKLAEGMLNRLARIRTGPADIVGNIRRIAVDLSSDSIRKTRRVNGFLVTSDKQHLRLYNIDLIGGHVDVLENAAGVSIRGDVHARHLCAYITKKVSFSSMSCEAAAKHLHILASDVAEHVASVGERGSYGFDLGFFSAAGGSKLRGRLTEHLGRIDMHFRVDDQAVVFASGGGCEQ